MNVRFTKGKVLDYIHAERADGTTLTTTFPHKGVALPHDAVHLVVEQAMAYRWGFWGRVCAGLTPQQVAAIVKAGGQASAKRAVEPTSEIVELLHAERLVECFEADMWGGPTDALTFRCVLDAACAESRVAAIDLTDELIERVRGELAELRVDWQSLSVGESMELSWS